MLLNTDGEVKEDTRFLKEYSKLEHRVQKCLARNRLDRLCRLCRKMAKVLKFKIIYIETIWNFILQTVFVD